ncbi:MAG: alpha-E domain-containing protein [Planctomycetota bacterium]
MLSRVADSVYWTGRYLERAEHTAHLIETNLNLMLEASPQSHDHRWPRLLGACLAPEIDGLKPDDAYEAVHALALSEDNPQSIRACILNARENLRQVRERVPTEVFEQLNTLYFKVKQTRLESIWGYRPDAFFRSIRHGIHLFHGLTDATVPHEEGWHFLQLGRSLERAQGVARLVHAHAPLVFGSEEDEADRYLAWVGLLKSCEAYMPFLERYRSRITPTNIAGYLLLDEDFPRSVRYAVDQVAENLEAISLDTGGRRAARLTRLAGRLQAQLSYAQIDEVMDAGLMNFLHDVLTNCGEIHAAVYRAYIAYPVEEVAI